MRVGLSESTGSQYVHPSDPALLSDNRGVGFLVLPMSYEIIIRQKKIVRKTVGKNWAVIGTEEESRNSEFYMRDKEEPKTRIKDVYGYTPEVEKDQEVEIEVLKQTVESMDLALVIKAINGL